MKYRTLCCETVIESRHRHDFKTCPCGKTSVDGGDDYSRSLTEDGTPQPFALAPEGRPCPDCRHMCPDERLRFCETCDGLGVIYEVQP